MLDLDKIYELAKGIDHHLRQLEGCMDVLREMRDSLEQLVQHEHREKSNELELLRAEVRMLARKLEEQGMPHSSDYEIEYEAIKEQVQSDSWPVAVNPEFLCNNAEKEKLRARSIVELVIAENFDDQKFLDFGCGHGHVPPIVHQAGAQISIGYDPNEFFENHRTEEYTLTSSWERVTEDAPYDIILLHDVLDHCIDPIEALLQIKGVLSQSGRIYVRNHPWCARHGGHLYLTKNKAFLHLLMDEVELQRLEGLTCVPTTKILYPLPTYRDWFKKAGLHIRSELPITSEVEDFFLDQAHLYNRLAKQWNNIAEIKDNMAIDFVDYVLDARQGIDII